jgi:hypothetical protein
LIATPHNLVVVPYRLEAQRLSALVGAHCSGTAQAEHDSDVQELHHTLCSNWVTNGTTKDAPSQSDQQIPEALKEQLQALEAEGCCQSMLVYVFINHVQFSTADYMVQYDCSQKADDNTVCTKTADVSQLMFSAQVMIQSEQY